MRQRRNVATTHAVLENPSGKVPPLPPRGKGRGAWLPQVRAWWEDVWKSQMASQYQPDVHRHGLEAIAELRQQFHLTDEPAKLIALHAEIRLAQRDYGLTPMDLRRLQWEIKRVDGGMKAKETGRKPPRKAIDPRKALELVK